MMKMRGAFMIQRHRVFNGEQWMGFEDWVKGWGCGRGWVFGTSED